MKKWLLKTEPGTYSFSDLTRDGRTCWDGVSNPVALGHLRAMKKGDEAFFYHTGSGGNFALPLFGEWKPIVLQNQERIDLIWDQVTPSPDGKWLAFNYGSPPEVFVAAFPGVTHRRQVSVGGGVQPQWSRSGSELLYLNPQGTLMSVPMMKSASGSSIEPIIVHQATTPACRNTGHPLH